MNIDFQTIVYSNRKKANQLFTGMEEKICNVFEVKPIGDPIAE